MHNWCVFFTFSTVAQRIFKGWGCKFSWSFDKVVCSKSMKMVFMARIIRHKLCMIYAFFDFFCSKLIFDQKVFSYCWDKFDYPGSIVYLSCFNLLFGMKLRYHISTKITGPIFEKLPDSTQQRENLFGFSFFFPFLQNNLSKQSLAPFNTLRELYIRRKSLLLVYVCHVYIIRECYLFLQVWTDNGIENFI